MVVVETPDAILVAQMSKTQHVKNIVDSLKRVGRPEGELRRNRAEHGLSFGAQHRLRGDTSYLVSENELEERKAEDLINFPG